MRRHCPTLTRRRNVGWFMTHKPSLGDDDDVKLFYGKQGYADTVIDPRWYWSRWRAGIVPNNVGLEHLLYYLDEDAIRIDRGSARSTDTRR
jgi:hypothetical protein